MPPASKPHSGFVILRDALHTLPNCTVAEAAIWNEEALEVLSGLEEHLRRLEEQFDALLKVAEGLFQMIDRETWRATGGDDQQGHYEGDYRAAQIEEYLVVLRASNPASKPSAPPDNPSYQFDRKGRIVSNQDKSPH